MVRVNQKEVIALKEELERLIATAQNHVATISSDQESYCTAMENLTALDETLILARKKADKALAAEERFKSLEDRAEELNQIADKNVKALANLENQAESLVDRINELLPGAASGALASSFDKRKQDLKCTKLIWTVLFFAAIVFLVVASFYDRPETLPTELKSMYLYLLGRLPLIAPIAWLAYHTSQRSTQSFRLEEDYAHKEALSRSFEGYKNQIQELQENGEILDANADGNALHQLITITIEALSKHPDRVYKGHKDGGPLVNLMGFFTNKNSETRN
jgi:hypothetical protein